MLPPFSVMTPFRALLGVAGDGARTGLLFAGCRLERMVTCTSVLVGSLACTMGIPICCSSEASVSSFSFKPSNSQDALAA